MNEINKDIILENTSARPRPALLLLIDGWGVAPVGEANILSRAKSLFFLSLVKEYPVAVLETGNKTWNARYLSIGSGNDLNDENIKISNTLSSVISGAGWKQVKISETERFAALTNFFNGGRDEKILGEEWKIISSHIGLKTIPPLLALKRTVKEIIKTVESMETPDLIIASLPYLDLVAKSGDLMETKKAVDILDKNLKKIVASVLVQGGVIFISSAGGNVEHMCHLGTDLLDNELTSNPVPFFIIGQDFKGKTIGLADPLNNDLSLLAPAGTLADLAPTILHILKLNKPESMTGKSLLDIY